MIDNSSCHLVITVTLHREISSFNQSEVFCQAQGHLSTPLMKFINLREDPEKENCPVQTAYVSKEGVDNCEREGGNLILGL